VDVLRERPPVVDQREAVVLTPELHAAGLLVPQSDPGVGRDGRVEALGRRELGDADPQVVERGRRARGAPDRRARPRLVQNRPFEGFSELPLSRDDADAAVRMVRFAFGCGLNCG
jgi:hypothetical protein